MKSKFLQAGEIVNTHGIVGEVKILPWCDSADFLCGFDTFYIDGAPVKVRSARVHKTNLLAMLEGVTDVNAAMRLKGKIIEIDRSGIELPDGRHFIADMMDLEVLDADSGELLGKVTDVLTPPAHEVYVVTGGAHAYMIPAVDAFVIESNPQAGYLRVRLIEGMETDVSN
ncbi:MAG: ribosome maturation factor RimM [Pseudoflavonifractor sp.]